MAATQTYLSAWPPPRPAVDWLHALTRHRIPVQFPLEWSGQLLVKSDKPVTATISSYKLLAACSVELYLNGRAVRITLKTPRLLADDAPDRALAASSEKRVSDTKAERRPAKAH